METKHLWYLFFESKRDPTKWVFLADALEDFGLEEMANTARMIYQPIPDCDAYQIWHGVFPEIVQAIAAIAGPPWPGWNGRL